MLKKLLILIILFNIILIMSTYGLSDELNQSILYVNKTGSGNFTTIQEAIDAADTGFKIYVFNGTYHENIVIDKSIVLEGENRNLTIIDGRSAGNAIKVNADSVTITGFTIQKSGNLYPNSGINLSSNFNIIEGNLITENFYGITFYNSFGNKILNNTIQNDDHCGIYLSSSSNNTFINNTIRNNVFNGIGIYYSSENNLISGNNFINNRYCGINIRSSQKNNITGNDFSNNNIGIHIPANNFVDNNDFSNNKIDIEREIDIGNFPFLLVGFIAILAFFGIILIIQKYRTI